MAIKQYKGEKGKSDKIFGQVIRAQGKCEHCNSTQTLQTAHIISRKYSKVRCDTRNAFCLCAKCHFHFTANPLEFAEWTQETWAQQYVPDVRRKAYDTLAKIDWEERIAFLKPILDGQLTLDEARKLEK